jgi:N6-L-threonylcarbamoyladenine synthase
METRIPSSIDIGPSFPFLSVLASGGHTLLISSISLTEHEILGSTVDIAVGECLDKVARTVLPLDILQQARSTMYGALLEEFAFARTSEPNSGHVREVSEKKAGHSRPGQYVLERNSARAYQAMYASRYACVVDQDIRDNTPVWAWKLTQPLTRSAGGLKSRSLEMSFSGLTTAAERVMRYKTDPTSGKLTRIERDAEKITFEERRALSKEIMRLAFGHIASRVVLALQHLSSKQSGSIPVTVVMSGGVASNSYLRYLYVAFCSITAWLI